MIGEKLNDIVIWWDVSGYVKRTLAVVGVTLIFVGVIFVVVARRVAKEDRRLEGSPETILMQMICEIELSGAVDESSCTWWIEGATRAYSVFSPRGREFGCPEWPLDPEYIAEIFVEYGRNNRDAFEGIPALRTLSWAMEHEFPCDEDG